MAYSRISLIIIISIVLTDNSVFAKTYADDNYLTTHSPNKLIGRWNLVARITHEFQIEPLHCIEQTINRTKDEDVLSTSVVSVVNGHINSYKWLLEVHDMNLVHYSSQYGARIEEHSELFDIFIDSGLFIQYNVTEIQPYTIYSRDIITNFALKFYVDKAEKNGWYFQYVDTRLCHARNATQEIIDKDISNRLRGNWTLAKIICPKDQLGADEDVLSTIRVDKMDNGISLEMSETTRFSNFINYWPARIFISQLLILDNTDYQPRVQNLTFYNSYNEVFFENKKNNECDQIWSRQGSVSEESLKIYEAIAKNKSWTLINVKLQKIPFIDDNDRDAI